MRWPGQRKSGSILALLPALEVAEHSLELGSKVGNVCTVFSTGLCNSLSSSS